MKSYLLVCSCHSMDKRAISAFNLIKPGEPTPPVIKGRDRIYKLAQETPNDHIKAISKLVGKFAYYIKLDDDNKIVEEYDLQKGSKIA